MVLKELNLIILDKNENFLGTLNPSLVSITEDNELYNHRKIHITHPILDDDGVEYSEYLDLLVHGNKVWQQQSCDGDSCLYVLNGDKTVDYVDNIIEIRATEVSIELGEIPPIYFNPLNLYLDDFADGKWQGRSAPYKNITLNKGSLSIVSGANAISGQYSLKFTGDGTSDLSNFTIPTTFHSQVTEFDLRFDTLGTNAGSPHFVIYVKSNGPLFIYAEIYHTTAGDTSTRIWVEEREYATGRRLVLEDWIKGAKPETGKIYKFRIEDSGNYLRYFINGSIVAEVYYTIQPSSVVEVLFGTRYNTSIVLDNITFIDYNVNKHITINTELLENIYGDYYDIGEFPPGLTLEYHGSISPLGLIRKIEETHGLVFTTQYTYQRETDTIKRTLHLKPLETYGHTHTTPFEIGYNTENIILEEDEHNVAIATGLIGADTADEFQDLIKEQNRMQRWIQFQAHPDTQIPLWVTVDQDGNETTGPLAYPPYIKEAGDLFVVANPSDTPANYTNCQHKQDTYGSDPRTFYSSTSEEHPVNIYWYFVGLIRSKLYPSVIFESEILDINHLISEEDTGRVFFNKGDVVYLRVPGRDLLVQSRVVSTVKDPRSGDKDKVVIGNFVFDLFDYLRGNIVPSFLES